VNRTEVVHSQHVVAELLELIMNADRLGLTLSEVEGDAVLFFMEGEIPPLEAGSSIPAAFVHGSELRTDPLSPEGKSPLWVGIDVLI